jgi:hypothetical protein
VNSPLHKLHVAMSVELKRERERDELGPSFSCEFSTYPHQSKQLKAVRIPEATVISVHPFKSATDSTHIPRRLDHFGMHSRLMTARIGWLVTVSFKLLSLKRRIDAAADEACSSRPLYLLRRYGVVSSVQFEKCLRGTVSMSLQGGRAIRLAAKTFTFYHPVMLTSMCRPRSTGGDIGAGPLGWERYEWARRLRSLLFFQSLTV